MQYQVIVKNKSGAVLESVEVGSKIQINNIIESYCDPTDIELSIYEVSEDVKLGEKPFGKKTIVWY